MGVGPLGQLHRPGHRNHPPVRILPRVKHILDMGIGKMLVLRTLQGLFKPPFPGYIGRRFQPGRRHRLQKLAFPGKKGKVLHIILSIVIKQRHLSGDALLRQIRVFDHSIIKRVGKLHDIAEPGIHRSVQLVHQDLVFLLQGIRNLVRHPDIQGNPDENAGRQSRHRKVYENTVADADPPEKLPQSAKHHASSPAAYRLPLNFVGETPNRFLNT